MKCEICQKNEAETAIRIGESSDEELYVCKACAEKEERKRKKKRDRTRKEQLSEDAEEISDPLMKEFVAAMSGLGNVLDEVIKSAQKAQEGRAAESGTDSKVPFKIKSRDKKVMFAGYLHLEGIAMCGEIDAVKRAMRAIGLELCGFDTEGLSDVGHIYCIMHQGAADKDKAERAAKAIIEQEHNARKSQIYESPRLYTDAICRSLAILKNCRVLTDVEYFDLLSPLRLAAQDDFLDGITLAKIESMMKRLGPFNMKQPEDSEIIFAKNEERADEANSIFENVFMNEHADHELGDESL